MFFEKNLLTKYFMVINSMSAPRPPRQNFTNCTRFSVPFIEERSESPGPMACFFGHPPAGLSKFKFKGVAYYSPEISGLCLMKLSNEMLQNLPYFWIRRTK